jgi:hypothetical protein
MSTLRAVAAGFSMGVLLLAWAPPAHAGSCKAEVEKLCKGRTDLMKCLRENERDLSPGCNAYLRFFENMPSCVADARKMCPSDQPSGAAVIACLRKHQTDLSEDCKNEMRKIR